MNEIQFSTSACRFCRFYEPEGRRGGSCQKLGVSVEGNWQACALAAPPFDTTLKKLEDVFQLETSIPLKTSAKLTFKATSTDVKGDRAQISFSKMVSTQLE